MAHRRLRRELAAVAVEGRAWRGGGSTTGALAAEHPARGDEAPAPRADRDWYVTVDELIDATAVLHVTPWPLVDERGRLRFPDRETGFTVEAPAQRLRALADAGRSVARPLRVGDVFRARMAAPASRHGVDLMSLLAAGGLQDVSAEAREAAKAQSSAAVSPVLGVRDAWALYRDMTGEEPAAPG